MPLWRHLPRSSCFLLTAMFPQQSPGQCPGVFVSTRAELLNVRYWLKADISWRLVSERDLLIIQLNFADDVERRPFTLHHEKLTHRDRVLKHNVGDVEIMGNHHQVRGIAVF